MKEVVERLRRFKVLRKKEDQVGKAMKKTTMMLNIARVDAAFPWRLCGMRSKASK